jgi:hypothetical protein
MASKNPLYATFDALYELLSDRRKARQILDAYPDELRLTEVRQWIRTYQQGKLGVDEVKILNQINDSLVVQQMLHGQ